MLAVATLALLPALAAAAPATGSIRTRAARIHPRGHKDKCLAVQVYNDEIIQWDDVKIRDCKGQYGLGFTWIVDSRIGTTGGVLAAEGSNMCLEAGLGWGTGWRPSNGARTQVTDCNGQPTTDTQLSVTKKWTYTARGQFKYDSKESLNFFCLDNANGNLADGNKVQIWQCGNGNKNQLWDIEYLD